MKKKISKKDNELFQKKVKEILKEYGAVEPGYFIYQYKLNTKYGELGISIYEEQSTIYSIYTMFDNPKKAMEDFNCNPYSGKYNMYEFDMDVLLSYFKDMLDKACIN